MYITNYTPHTINIIKEGYGFSSEVKRYVSADAKVAVSLPSSGMLSAKIDTVEMPSIGKIPVFGKTVTGIDPMPEADAIITSAMYAQAAQILGYKTDKLYTIADPVYDLSGRTVLGCLGVSPVLQGSAVGNAAHTNAAEFGDDVRIYNGTSLSVKILKGAEYTFSIRKYTATENMETVSELPSNGVLTAKMDITEMPPLENIPVWSKKVTGIDQLPDGYDIYIVPALYVSAARAVGADVSKLYTVADPVYTPDGRTILGCRGLCPAL